MNLMMGALSLKPWLVLHHWLQWLKGLPSMSGSRRLLKQAPEKALNKIYQEKTFPLVFFSFFFWYKKHGDE
uniref:Uncharacterized protein n=1 Tax=Arundo donax TaxID=35708 RepID=A0A0A9A508_ARUDO